MELCSPDGYCLRLPAGTSSDFYDRLASIPTSERRPWLVHTVGRGETMKSIAHLYGIDPTQLASYNDMTTHERVRRGERLRVPMTVMAPQRGSDEAAPAETSPTRENVPTSSSSLNTRMHLIRHRVRRHETLQKIASANGVSVASLRQWNGLSRHSRLHTGEQLKIYEMAAAPKSHSRMAAASSATSSDGSAQYHTVRPGETLTRIAHNFATTPKQLSEWNDGLAASDLQAGMKIKVSGGDVASTQESQTVSPTRHSHIATPNRRALTYRVRPGDTLTAISERFGVEISALKHANHLRGSMLAAGLQLRIPH